MEDFTGRQIAQFGEGVQRLGAGAVDVSRQLRLEQKTAEEAAAREAARQQAMQNQLDDAMATEATNKLMDRLRETEIEANRYDGKAFIENLPQIHKTTTDDIQKIRDGLGNDVQRVQFDAKVGHYAGSLFAKLRMRSDDEAKKYEAGERVKHVENLIDITASDTTGWGAGQDPQKATAATNYEVNRGLIRNEIVRLGELKGLPANSEQVQADIQDAYSKLHERVITNMVDARRPGEAHSYLEHWQGKGEINDEQSKKLGKLVSESYRGQIAYQMAFDIEKVHGSFIDQSNALDEYVAGGGDVTLANTVRGVLENRDSLKRKAVADAAVNDLSEAKRALLTTNKTLDEFFAEDPNRYLRMEDNGSAEKAKDWVRTGGNIVPSAKLNSEINQWIQSGKEFKIKDRDGNEAFLPSAKNISESQFKLYFGNHVQPYALNEMWKSISEIQGRMPKPDERMMNNLRERLGEKMGVRQTIKLTSGRQVYQTIPGKEDAWETLNRNIDDTWMKLEEKRNGKGTYEDFKTLENDPLLLEKLQGDKYPSAMTPEEFLNTPIGFANGKPIMVRDMGENMATYIMSGDPKYLPSSFINVQTALQKKGVVNPTWTQLAEGWMDMYGETPTEYLKTQAYRVDHPDEFRALQEQARRMATLPEQDVSALTQIATSLEGLIMKSDPQNRDTLLRAIKSTTNNNARGISFINKMQAKFEQEQQRERDQLRSKIWLVK